MSRLVLSHCHTCLVSPTGFISIISVLDCGLSVIWVVVAIWALWVAGPVYIALEDFNCSIRDLNNKMTYDLSEKLDNFFGNADDLDDNVFVNDVKDHKYFDTSNLCNNFNQNTSFMLSINVCSLMSKHEKLMIFINKLQAQNCNILLIAIQETWNLQYPDLVDIPNFKFVFKTRSLSRGGGVAFYILNNIQYKELIHLSYFEERVFECLTVELTINKKKCIVSNIYKSPNPANGSQLEHNELFISYLDTHLYNLAQCNCDVYVFTDSNLNLLNINNNNTTALYLETIYSNGFNQKVGKATRICNNNFSLIDHVFSKSSNLHFSTGTLLTDISDHMMNFIAFPDVKIVNNHQFCMKRDFSTPKI